MNSLLFEVLKILGRWSKVLVNVATVAKPIRSGRPVNAQTNQIYAYNKRKYFLGKSKFCGEELLEKSE